MLALLRKLWFVTVFLILASLSLGALFGYRFSLQEKNIQQRGVMFLEGDETEITMVLDDNTSIITLPYLDSNIAIGDHTVKLLKAGFKPYTVSFTSSKDRAIHLKVDMTPVESRILSTTFKSSNTLKHFFLNDRILLEYYTESRLLSYFEEAASLRIHKPEKVFNVDFLFPGEVIESFHSFKDHKVLLKTNQHWRICSIDVFSCILVDISIKDRLFSEQKNLLAYLPEKTELWTIQEQTGKLDVLLSKTIKEVTENSMMQKSPVNTYDYFFRSSQGSGSVLKQDFFGPPRLITLSGFVPSVKSILQKNDDTLLVTSTGALISEKTSLILDSDINMLYPESKGIFMIKSLGDVFLSPGTTNNFLTRFSTAPKAIFTIPDALFGFVVFQNEILHCEQQKLSYCTQLISLEKFDTVHYSQKEHFFTFVSKDGTDTIYTLYFLPSESTLF